VSKDKRGKPVLYMELYKSMYGLMRSALLFSRKLKKELLEYGFMMNPYDPCVANLKTKDGSQLTVLWHVDDLKLSCKNGWEVTRLLLYLKRIYGSGIAVHLGNKFRYLGMDLDYSEKGVFAVSMVGYTDQIIGDFPEEITKSSACPHNENLFKIREESEARYLPEEQAIKFHHSVAQLVFLQKRARRDIQTVVSFLATRVKRPDEDDWGKLPRVLQYLKGTRSLKLRITIDCLKEAKWYVDAAYNVHWDCKGQSDGAMKLGKGAVISSSTKQKTNSKSACKSELIGVDDNISTMLWSLYSMQEQGINISNIRLYQDNKSTILLENNDKMSSSKRTKHIKAKFFFITDRIEQGDVTVEWLPTDKMWIDVNMKPKTGLAYRRDRAMIMNCPINLPDETILHRKLPGTYDAQGVKLIDAPKRTVQTSETKPALRLQECVGETSISTAPMKLRASKISRNHVHSDRRGHERGCAKCHERGLTKRLATTEAIGVT
jgi:hypothetical protein